ncbi:vesicle-trafficking protein SEC22b-like [Dysidea avara]|uniref:vesicle-trafficking protein SEC22b-like n=1 Tax=Dysidea avara TaxID=196820 RepID=UPI0033277F05
MALLTLIARSTDGLPLSSSIESDEQSGKNLTEFQSQAKAIFRKLSPQSPPRCSIESPPLVFHYVIESEICYLVLCEPSYSPRLAFSYLRSLHEAFSQQHGHEVHKAQRPYHFIEFGTEIERLKKAHSENQSRGQLGRLADELQGVQKIMIDNIDAALNRGELISDLADKTRTLAVESKMYAKEAKFLNLRTSLAAKAAIVVVIILILIFLRFWLF